MEDGGRKLHVVVFPWLAMGHLIPFFRLSAHFARRGHRVSFISTPKNLRRLPKSPSHPLITLIPLPLPIVPNLPRNAESSSDILPRKSQLLKKAFDLLKSPLLSFLKTANPDWIVHDYASHWLPPLAAGMGIPCVFFSLFTAACLAFTGPPEALAGGAVRDLATEGTEVEDLTIVPEWVPFESNVGYRPHEVVKIMESSGSNESGTPDGVRFGATVMGSEFVGIRSCPEFEPEWFQLLVDLYRKPVVPVGFLPPLEEEIESGQESEWVRIKAFLDSQRVDSVVYVALGSEATLSGPELRELALGLEESKLPFFWVLRTSHPESAQDDDKKSAPTPLTLPDGFEERVRGRGMVYAGWAPQVRILSHPAAGGFLTHCGWNSVVEGAGLGLVLILLPVLNDQGLNARLLEGKGLGVEIERNERDGRFTHDSVAKSVRLAMVDEAGEPLRVRATEMRGLFGDGERNDHCVDNFVDCLILRKENRPKSR